MESNQTIITQVASEFSTILRSWLTDKEMDEINAKNKTPEYEGCCASHDYCDSNMAMIEALEKLGLDFMSIDSALVNNAWTLAMNNEFKA